MSYAPIYPHGHLEQIGDEVYVLRGSIKLNPIMRITRNMVLVREGSEISLINPVRTNDEVLKQIAALGKISHVVRTGAFHGIDDPFYVEQFSATMWAQPGGVTYTTPTIDKEIDESTELPFSRASLVTFKNTKEPELALLIADGDGLLITCDAIQHYGDYSYNNLPARLMMPLIGFPKETLVGPIWTKVMATERGSLEDDLRQLLNLDFNRLIAAHGTYLETGAYNAVKNAIDKAFAK